MTKQQQRDFLNMLKTAIPASRINGVWKKLYGTWSGIDFKLRTIIIHLLLWKWAAMHHEDFKYFEISYTKILRIIVTRTPLEENFVMTIRLQKPRFYLFEPIKVVTEFILASGIQIDF